SELEIKRY
nr:Chain B, Trans-activator protein BZLF1 [human gammaherpesvirus 4]